MAAKYEEKRASITTVRDPDSLLFYTMHFWCVNIQKTASIYGGGTEKKVVFAHEKSWGQEK